MSPRNTLASALVAGWVAVIGAGAVCLALGAPQDNPHADLDRPGGCDRCHVGDPRPDNGAIGGGALRRYTKDVVSLCLECHTEKDTATLHPVDVRPGMEVPDDLPLDADSTITCGTCHNPHLPPTADEPYVAEELGQRLISLFITGGDEYRTLYLRRRNDQGQLCAGCHREGTIGRVAIHLERTSRLDRYAGSSRCGQCHADRHGQWQQTLHAKMVRDARAEPEAVVADFDHPDAPFDREKVSYVIGSRWNQRFVVEQQGQYVVKAAIWSVPASRWDTAYWTDKPWDRYCMGCHTTGFELLEAPAFAEPGIGCEACHGPGRAHADSEGREAIVNPSKLTRKRREMICQSCHTAGHDVTGQFRFPLGYLPGMDLTRYYKGLMPKPGQDNSSFAGDGSYDDRQRQWDFWKGGYMEVRGLSCDICKNFRSNFTQDAQGRMSVSEHCLSCHAEDRPADPLHERHQGQAHCDECHQPTRTADGSEYSIHDHKFMFGAPVAGGAATPDRGCGRCHGDDPVVLQNTPNP